MRDFCIFWIAKNFLVAISYQLEKNWVAFVAKIIHSLSSCFYDYLMQ